ncbi:MAG: J domain-containing protein, partial [Symploca sp. SIO2B6]|nr:J domain-containing protein [Symploca sp. SIO2B6]
MDDSAKCYQILEIEPGASLEDINQAYKDLVFIWHPDRIPKDNIRLQQKAQAKLQDLNHARDVLRKRHKNASRSRTPWRPSQGNRPQDNRTQDSHATNSRSRRSGWRSPYSRSRYAERTAAQSRHTQTQHTQAQYTRTQNSKGSTSTNSSNNGKAPTSQAQNHASSARSQATTANTATAQSNGHSSNVHQANPNATTQAQNNGTEESKASQPRAKKYKYNAPPRPGFNNYYYTPLFFL